MLIINIILILSTTSVTGVHPITDFEILEQAKNNCKNIQPEKVDIELLAKLLNVEKYYGIPNSLRGLLLAAACQESGYNPRAKGDHRFSKNKKPKAIGILQLWPWWASKKWGYGVDRNDPMASAHVYLQHISSFLKRVYKQCHINKKDKRRAWVAAWVTGIRAYKKGGRCREKPNHLRTVKKWHKAIHLARKNM